MSFPIAHDPSKSADLVGLMQDRLVAATKLPTGHKAALWVGPSTCLFRSVIFFELHIIDVCSVTSARGLSCTGSSMPTGQTASRVCAWRQLGVRGAHA